MPLLGWRTRMESERVCVCMLHIVGWILLCFFRCFLFPFVIYISLISIKEKMELL